MKYHVNQAPGEAEAELALLNGTNLIDAVMTDDGDTFIFGATCVIKKYVLIPSPTSVGILIIVSAPTSRKMEIVSLSAPQCRFSQTRIHDWHGGVCYSLHFSVVETMTRWAHSCDICDRTKNFCRPASTIAEKQRHSMPHTYSLEMSFFMLHRISPPLLSQFSLSHGVHSSRRNSWQTSLRSWAAEQLRLPMLLSKISPTSMLSSSMPSR